MRDKGYNVKYIGEFLIQKGIISSLHLNDALDMQRHNKDRRIGEILVTQGVISKEQLIMAVEMFIIESGITPNHADEWLDQEEIDMIKEKIR